MTVTVENPDLRIVTDGLRFPEGPVAMADGSVHLISNFINITGNVVNNPSVWDRLNTSADGYTLDGSAY